MRNHVRVCDRDVLGFVMNALMYVLKCGIEVSIGGLCAYYQKTIQAAKATFMAKTVFSPSMLSPADLTKFHANEITVTRHGQSLLCVSSSSQQPCFV